MQKIKLKTCIQCKEKFKPFQTTQRACSPKCALEHARKKERAKADKAFRERKSAFKSQDIKLRKKVAQQAFNAYIRERDKAEPCISCQRHHLGQYHAGHFKTTAARPDLRFNEDNCHKQCSVCNNHKSGNIDEYIFNLVEKIGLKRFKLLKLEKRIKWTAEDYKNIEIKYKAKLKEMQGKQ